MLGVRGADAAQTSSRHSVERLRAMNHNVVTVPRPPMVGVTLAVGLHLALLTSLPISASKSSTADATFVRATVMAVRSLNSTAAVELPAAPKSLNSSPSADPQHLASTQPISPTDAFKRSAAVLKPAPQRVDTPPTQAAGASPAISSLLMAAAAAPLAPTNDLPAAPQYRAAGTLDPGPKPLSDINPDYPGRAGQQQGVVVLRLLINEQGAVDNVAVVRATPVGYFEESALEAFGKALFSPGKFLGVAVKSQITVEVEFMPINRGATVSGRTY